MLCTCAIVGSTQAATIAFNDVIANNTGAFGSVSDGSLTVSASGNGGADTQTPTAAGNRAVLELGQTKPDSSDFRQ